MASSREEKKGSESAKEKLKGLLFMTEDWHEPPSEKAFDRDFDKFALEVKNLTDKQRKDFQLIARSESHYDPDAFPYRSETLSLFQFVCFERGVSDVWSHARPENQAWITLQNRERIINLLIEQQFKPTRDDLIVIGEGIAEIRHGVAPSEAFRHTSKGGDYSNKWHASFLEYIYKDLIKLFPVAEQKEILGKRLSYLSDKKASVEKNIADRKASPEEEFRLPIEWVENKSKDLEEMIYLVKGYLSDLDLKNTLINPPLRHASLFSPAEPSNPATGTSPSNDEKRPDLGAGAGNNEYDDITVTWHEDEPQEDNKDDKEQNKHQRKNI